MKHKIDFLYHFLINNIKMCYSGSYVIYGQKVTMKQLMGTLTKIFGNKKIQDVVKQANDDSKKFGSSTTFEEVCTYDFREYFSEMLVKKRGLYFVEYPHDHQESGNHGVFGIYLGYFEMINESNKPPQFEQIDEEEANKKLTKLGFDKYNMYHTILDGCDCCT